MFMPVAFTWPTARHWLVISHQLLTEKDCCLPRPTYTRPAWSTYCLSLELSNIIKILLSLVCQFKCGNGILLLKKKHSQMWVHWGSETLPIFYLVGTF